MLNQIKNLIKLGSEILNVYPYGSRVYGTNSYSSDYDYIVIANSDITCRQFDTHDGNLSVHVYNPEYWKHALEEHKIFALECEFLPDNLIIQKDINFSFQLNKSALRKEISSVASNSWVKAKKKIEVENDFYIGYKSLFHSLRIPKFGIQIAKTGRIHDYGEANSLWKEIEAVRYNIFSQNIWTDLKEKYQPIRNEILSEFRLYAEK